MTTKIYDTNSTRAEELQGLTKLSSVFKSGSYLYDFFTPDLFRWIERTIQDDLVPDLMGYVKSAEDEARTWHQKSVDNERRAIAAEKALQDEKQAAIDFEKAAQAQLTRLQEIVEKKNESIDHWSQTAHKNGQRVYELQAELIKAQEEIITLKAKLYDLMEKSQ